MGNLCSSCFPSGVRGNGYRLNETPSGDGRRTSGGGGGGGRANVASGDSAAAREARARAAEARAQEAAKRGVQNGGGKLAAKLETERSAGGKIPLVERDNQPDVADEWRRS